MQLRRLRSRWVSALLVLLAVPNVVAGVWGVIAPVHWFEHFPGWAPRLVAAHPPFNEHLVTDSASGLLAAGVAALIALCWRRPAVVVTAMLTHLAFSVPHAVFHVLHPVDALSTADDLTNVGALLINVAAALAVGWVAVAAVRESDAQPSRPQPQ